MVCFAAMIIGVGFALVGCEKQNAGNFPDSVEPTIYGNWQGYQFDIDNNDVWVDITRPPHDADFTFTIQFNEDGTYEGTGYLGNGGGTFTISNGVITLYKEDIYLYATYRIIELTHEQMEVVVNMNSGVFRFRMRRLLITIEPWEDGGA